MNLTSFQLIKILREKIGEEQAESLASFVETKVKEEIDSKKEGFATKEDIAKLETKIELSKIAIILWFIATMLTLISLSTGLIIHFAK